MKTQSDWTRKAPRSLNVHGDSRRAVHPYRHSGAVACPVHLFIWLFLLHSLNILCNKVVIGKKMSQTQCCIYKAHSAFCLPIEHRDTAL